MTARAFSTPEGRRAIGEAVAAAEALTSAEVVVAIRRRASAYAGTSVVAGLVLGLVAVALLWFSPRVYDARLMPLEGLAVAAISAYLVQSIDPLRRRLTPRSRRDTALRGAVSRTFVELGVERTRARNGVLVYVALFEGTVRLRPDQGIDEALLGEAERRLADAVARRDLSAFCDGVRALGETLASTHPRTDSDENELCDVHAD